MHNLFDRQVQMEKKNQDQYHYILQDWTRKVNHTWCLRNLAASVWSTEVSDTEIFRALVFLFVSFLWDSVSHSHLCAQQKKRKTLGCLRELHCQSSCCNGIAHKLVESECESIMLSGATLHCRAFIRLTQVVLEKFKGFLSTSSRRCQCKSIVVDLFDLPSSPTLPAQNYCGGLALSQCLRSSHIKLRSMAWIICP